VAEEGITERSEVIPMPPAGQVCRKKMLNLPNYIREMKKAVTFILLCAILVSCNKESDKEECLYIAPMPPYVELGEITDAMVPAEFTSDDFNWMGGNLTMNVWIEDIYDVVEVSLMKEGDTLFYDGREIVIKSSIYGNGIIVVNGGLEEGGAYLESNGGGTFRGVQFDDHSTYTLLGKTQIPLSENFIIVDCKEQYEEPSDTIRENQKLYIERLEGYKRSFNCLNTTVLVEDGFITEINRRWIP